MTVNFTLYVEAISEASATEAADRILDQFPPMLDARTYQPHTPAGRVTVAGGWLVPCQVVWPDVPVQTPPTQEEPS